MENIFRKENIKIIKAIGKGKSGISYLCEVDSRDVILKQMHNEMIDYYHFQKSKIQLEIEAYQVLEKLPIKIPKLLYYNIENEYLIKEYIKGETIAECIAKGELSFNIFEKIYSWATELEKQNVNIDYFPNNFVFSEDELYYIDYEINEYTAEWNFLNWGIYYWLNYEGFSKFMQTNDAQHINIFNTGKPIKTDQLEERKHVLLKKLENLLPTLLKTS